MVSALTFRAAGIIDKIITPVNIKDAMSPSRVQTSGLWDTGAQNSAITRSVASSLRLPVIRKAQVRGVHGIKEVNVYYIEIMLNNPNITVKCLVTECDELSDDGRVGLLLGMNVISKGDFIVTNHAGHTTMTFRVPSLEAIDFVGELEDYNRIRRIYDIQKKKGIEKCPCKSGKDFKNCHGKSIYHNR